MAPRAVTSTLPTRKVHAPMSLKTPRTIQTPVTTRSRVVQFEKTESGKIRKTSSNGSVARPSPVLLSKPTRTIDTRVLEQIVGELTMSLPAGPEEAESTSDSSEGSCQRKAARVRRKSARSRSIVHHVLGLKPGSEASYLEMKAVRTEATRKSYRNILQEFLSFCVTMGFPILLDTQIDNSLVAFANAKYALGCQHHDGGRLLA